MERGKHRIILIVELANSAKTFTLKPLQNIFGGNVVENLANDKFGWVGAQNAKRILLNDFRWSNKLTIWKDLLLLLEGEPVKLPTPIFATSKSVITFSQSL